MKIRFYKTGELNGSNYVEIPSRSNVISNIAKNDKYCFLWSILAYLHPCENSHPSRVKNYKHYFNELNKEGFEFTKGFKCSDVHKLEKLNKIFTNMFELNFHQDQNNWKQNLFCIEFGENDESHRVVDLLIKRKNYALIKKLKVFSGNHHKMLSVDDV